MTELTKEDWVEIYYALVDKQAKIDEGTYTNDDDILSTMDKEGVLGWSKHLESIIDTIGPDGENMTGAADYSEPEKELIGKKIAGMLYLSKSREEHGRYRTTWGTKTAVGIFETIRRIGAEIEAGTITTTLIKNE